MANSNGVTCNFRYAGCYLLVIISDGSDALRQQEIVKSLALNNSQCGATPDDWNLDRFDAEWSHRFIEHTVQLVGSGLSSWNTERTKCNLTALEEHIEQSQQQRPKTATSGCDNEPLLQFAHDSLAVEVLHNPTLSLLTQCLRNILRSPTGTVHVVYAGAVFDETGAWILDDGIFTPRRLYELIERQEVNKVANDELTCCAGHRSIAEHLAAHDIVVKWHVDTVGEWASLREIFAASDSKPVGKHLKTILNDPHQQRSSKRRHLFHFELNPCDGDCNGDVPGSGALLDFLTQRMTKIYTTRKSEAHARFATGGDSDLQESVGFVRLDRPTMYVFAAGHGDCALFGLDSGFTMLVDGGFLPGQRSFWPFVRHLEKLDSVLVTHLAEDNLFGLKALAENKLLRERHANFKAPTIGNVFSSTPLRPKGDASADDADFESPMTNLSLSGLIQNFAQSLQKLQIEPQMCGTQSAPQPVTLYYKTGHGTLSLVPLNAHESGELSSLCALLVWKPNDPKAKIVRILIPGSCSQKQILDGLEMLFDAKAQKVEVPNVGYNRKELSVLLTQIEPCTGEIVEKMIKKQTPKVAKGATTNHKNIAPRSKSLAPAKTLTKKTTTVTVSSQSGRAPATHGAPSRYRSVSPTKRPMKPLAPITPIAPVNSNNKDANKTGVGRTQLRSKPQAPPTTTTTTTKIVRIDKKSDAVKSAAPKIVPEKPTTATIRRLPPTQSATSKPKTVESKTAPSKGAVGASKVAQLKQQQQQNSGQKVFKSAKEFRQQNESTKKTSIMSGKPSTGVTAAAAALGTAAIAATVAASSEDATDLKDNEEPSIVSATDEEVRKIMQKAEVRDAPDVNKAHPDSMTSSPLLDSQATGISVAESDAYQSDGGETITRSEPTPVEDGNDEEDSGELVKAAQPEVETSRMESSTDIPDSTQESLHTVAQSEEPIDASLSVGSKPVMDEKIAPEIQTATELDTKKSKEEEAAASTTPESNQESKNSTAEELLRSDSFEEMERSIDSLKTPDIPPSKGSEPEQKFASDAHKSEQKVESLVQESSKILAEVKSQSPDSVPQESSTISTVDDVSTEKSRDATIDDVRANVPSEVVSSSQPEVEPPTLTRATTETVDKDSEIIPSHDTLSTSATFDVLSKVGQAGDAAVSDVVGESPKDLLKTDADNSVQQAVQDAPEAVSRKLSQSIEKEADDFVQPTVHEVSETVSRKLSESFHDDVDDVQQATDHAAKVEDARKLSLSKVENSPETVSRKLSEAVEGAHDSIQQTVEFKPEVVSRKLSDAGDKAHDPIQQAIEPEPETVLSKSSDIFGGATGSIQQTEQSEPETVSPKLSDAGDRAQDSIQQASDFQPETVSQKVSDAVDKVQDPIQEAVKSEPETAAKQPSEPLKMNVDARKSPVFTQIQTDNSVQRAVEDASETVLRKLSDSTHADEYSVEPRKLSVSIEKENFEKVPETVSQKLSDSVKTEVEDSAPETVERKVSQSLENYANSTVVSLVDETPKTVLRKLSDCRIQHTVDDATGTVPRKLSVSNEKTSELFDQSTNDSLEYGSRKSSIVADTKQDSIVQSSESITESETGDSKRDSFSQASESITAPQAVSADTKRDSIVQASEFTTEPQTIDAKRDSIGQGWEFISPPQAVSADSKRDSIHQASESITAPEAVDTRRDSIGQVSQSNTTPQAVPADTRRDSIGQAPESHSTPESVDKATESVSTTQESVSEKKPESSETLMQSVSDEKRKSADDSAAFVARMSSENAENKQDSLGQIQTELASSSALEDHKPEVQESVVRESPELSDSHIEVSSRKMSEIHEKRESIDERADSLTAITPELFDQERNSVDELPESISQKSSEILDKKIETEPEFNIESVISEKNGDSLATEPQAESMRSVETSDLKSDSSEFSDKQPESIVEQRIDVEPRKLSVTSDEKRDSFTEEPEVESMKSPPVAEPKTETFKPEVDSSEASKISDQQPQSELRKMSATSDKKRDSIAAEPEVESLKSAEISQQYNEIIEPEVDVRKSSGILETQPEVDMKKSFETSDAKPEVEQRKLSSTSDNNLESSLTVIGDSDQKSDSLVQKAESIDAPESTETSDSVETEISELSYQKRDSVFEATESTDVPESVVTSEIINEKRDSLLETTPESVSAQVSSESPEKNQDHFDVSTESLPKKVTEISDKKRDSVDAVPESEEIPRKISKITDETNDVIHEKIADSSAEVEDAHSLQQNIVNSLNKSQDSVSQLAAVIEPVINKSSSSVLSKEPESFTDSPPILASVGDASDVSLLLSKVEDAKIQSTPGEGEADARSVEISVQESSKSATLPQTEILPSVGKQEPESSELLSSADSVAKNQESLFDQSPKTPEIAVEIPTFKVSQDYGDSSAASSRKASEILANLPSQIQEKAEESVIEKVAEKMVEPLGKAASEVVTESSHSAPDSSTDSALDSKDDKAQSTVDSSTNVGLDSSIPFSESSEKVLDSVPKSSEKLYEIAPESLSIDSSSVSVGDIAEKATELSGKTPESESKHEEIVDDFSDSLDRPTSVKSDIVLSSGVIPESAVEPKESESSRQNSVGQILSNLSAEASQAALKISDELSGLSSQLTSTKVSDSESKTNDSLSSTDKLFSDLSTKASESAKEAMEKFEEISSKVAPKTLESGTESANSAVISPDFIEKSDQFSNQGVEESIKATDAQVTFAAPSLDFSKNIPEYSSKISDSVGALGEEFENISTKAAETAETTFGNFEEKSTKFLDSVDQKIADVSSKSQEFVSDALDKTERSISEFSTEIRESVSKITDSVEQTSANLKEKSEELSTNVADSVDKAVTDASKSATEFSDGIDQSVSDASEKALDSLKNISDSVEKTLDTSFDKLAETGSKTFGLFDQFVANSSDKTNKITSGTLDSAHDASAEVLDNSDKLVKEIGDQVLESAVNTSTSIEQTTSGLVSKTSDSLAETEQTAQDSVRDSLKNVSDFVDEAATKSETKFVEIEQEISEVSKKASDSVNEKATNLSNSGEKITTEVSESSAQILDKIHSDASTKSDEITSKAAEAKKEVENSAEDVVSDITRKASDEYSSLLKNADSVKEQILGSAIRKIDEVTESVKEDKEKLEQEVSDSEKELVDRTKEIQDSSKEIFENIPRTSSAYASIGVLNSASNVQESLLQFEKEFTKPTVASEISAPNTKNEQQSAQNILEIKPEVVASQAQEIVADVLKKSSETFSTELSYSGGPEYSSIDTKVDESLASSKEPISSQNDSEEKQKPSSLFEKVENSVTSGVANITSAAAAGLASIVGVKESEKEPISIVESGERRESRSAESQNRNSDSDEANEDSIQTIVHVQIEQISSEAALKDVKTVENQPIEEPVLQSKTITQNGSSQVSSDIHSSEPEVVVNIVAKNVALPGVGFSNLKTDSTTVDESLKEDAPSDKTAIQDIQSMTTSVYGFLAGDNEKNSEEKPLDWRSEFDKVSDFKMEDDDTYLPEQNIPADKRELGDYSEVLEPYIQAQQLDFDKPQSTAQNLVEDEKKSSTSMKEIITDLGVSLQSQASQLIDELTSGLKDVKAKAEKVSVVSFLNDNESQDKKAESKSPAVTSHDPNNNPEEEAEDVGSEYEPMDSIESHNYVGSLDTDGESVQGLTSLNYYNDQITELDTSIGQGDSVIADECNIETPSRLASLVPQTDVEIVSLDSDNSDNEILVASRIDETTSPVRGDSSKSKVDLHGLLGNSSSDEHEQKTDIEQQAQQQQEQQKTGSMSVEAASKENIPDSLVDQARVADSIIKSSPFVVEQLARVQQFDSGNSFGSESDALQSITNSDVINRIVQFSTLKQLEDTPDNGSKPSDAVKSEIIDSISTSTSSFYVEPATSMGQSFELATGQAQNILSTSSSSSSITDETKPESLPPMMTTSPTLPTTATTITTTTTAISPAPTELGNGQVKTAEAKTFDVDRDWKAPLGLPKVLPPKEQHSIYVELAYVPGHGSPGACDVAFFRRVRARNYVFSGLTDCRSALDALLQAKSADWPKVMPTTVIPTYESESLFEWIRVNEKAMADADISVAPAANRCSLTLAGDQSNDDHVCHAYKIEF